MASAQQYTSTTSRPVDTGAGARSLPDEINIATRQLHTHLNRLITARLPLCLPPHTSDPRIYASGLLHFAHVYFTFESLWVDIVKTHSTTTAPPSSSDAASSHAPDFDFDGSISPRISTLLSSLFDPALLRSSSLRADLHNTLDCSSPDLLEIALTQAPSPVVADYMSHIRTAVTAKPHVLLAYFWTMYMALFAGGRWIRGQLRTGLWPTAGILSDEKSACVAGISFFCFPGEMDGEDIKAAFKATFVEKASELLMPDEKADIVNEARTVFRFSTLMVEELDRLVGDRGANRVAGVDTILTSAAKSSNVSNGRINEAESQAEEKAKYALHSANNVRTALKPFQVSTFVQAQPGLAALLTLLVGLGGLFLYLSFNAF